MMTTHQEAHIQKLFTVQDSHTLQMQDLHRHLEDLDNRGRRNNLGVLVLPETVEKDQLRQAVMAILSNLLDRLCCLTSFRFKEYILRNARNQIQLSYENADIKIYLDWSPMTMQLRKNL